MSSTTSAEEEERRREERRKRQTATWLAEIDRRERVRRFHDITIIKPMPKKERSDGQKDR